MNTVPPPPRPARSRWQIKPASVAMDLAWVLACYLFEAAIDQVSRIVLPWILLVAFLALLYFYRYGHVHRIGGGVRPLHVQAGVQLPAWVLRGVIWIGFLVYFIFPPYLLTLLAAAANPSFSFDHWSPVAKLVLALVGMALTIVTATVMVKSSGEEVGEGKVRYSGWFYPGPPGRRGRRLLDWVIIPAVAAGVGVTGGALNSAFSVLTRDPGVDLTVALTIMAPLRYLVMRTEGVGGLTLVSFALTVGATAVLTFT